MNSTFPNGMFVMRYKGVGVYASMGKYQCLFGWMPKEFGSLRAFKCAVTRREKELT
jgi:hypothetical protein